MLFDRFKQVKAFVFAVDGVLADGGGWLTEEGERLYRFHSKDEYAIRLAIKRNYPIAIVGDANPIGIKRRMEGMGVKNLFFGAEDKRAVLRDWLSRQKLAAGEVLFMGNDIPDWECMKVVGLPTCPGDAVTEIKALAAYVSFCNGGDGAVRDVIEKVTKLQGTWI